MQPRFGNPERPVVVRDRSILEHPLCLVT